MRLLEFFRGAALAFKQRLIFELAGDMPVVLNCKILDYDVEQNDFSSGMFVGNHVRRIQSLIAEEMYTGSPGKIVTRRGNTFVLTIAEG